MYNPLDDLPHSVRMSLGSSPAPTHDSLVTNSPNTGSPSPHQCHITFNINNSRSADKFACAKIPALKSGILKTRAKQAHRKWDIIPSRNFFEKGKIGWTL